MSKSYNNIDNINPTQWIAEYEPSISLISHFNLAALANVNSSPLSNKNLVYQYNLIILLSDNIAYLYDPAVSV